jgi:mRNA-degrading endonuclease toxin of MazEF toxin-antitoxin module
MSAGILPDRGTILGNQLYTVSVERLGDFRGELDPQKQDELDRARLLISLGLPR